MFHEQSNIEMASVMGKGLGPTSPLMGLLELAWAPPADVSSTEALPLCLKGFDGC